MRFQNFRVDAFTIGDIPYTGNPAAVCILEYDDDILDSEKQKIAIEMNLSATAFVSEGWVRGEKKLELSSKVIRRTLRWFTPTYELPLCGHGTVASAKCIFDSISNIDEIEFQSKFKGILGAVVDRETSLITLDFPANPTKKLETQSNTWIKTIVQTTFGSKSGLSMEDVKDLQYSNVTKVLLIRLQDELTEVDLAGISPNFQKLLEIDTEDMVHHISVTVRGHGEGKPHFYSRFFLPWGGVNEDSATGIAHTVLTPYWTREFSQVGVMHARQQSYRGGDIYCSLLEDRVRLSARARVTVKGELFL